MKRRLKMETGRQYYVKPPFIKRGELGKFAAVRELD
jgi:hypothetical protein